MCSKNSKEVNSTSMTEDYIDYKNDMNNIGILTTKVSENDIKAISAEIATVLSQTRVDLHKQFISENQQNSTLMQLKYIMEDYQTDSSSSDFCENESVWCETITHETVENSAEEASTVKAVTEVPLPQLELEPEIPLVSHNVYTNHKKDVKSAINRQELELPQEKSLNLSNLLNNDIADIKIVIDADEFNCQFLILVNYSEYFMKMKYATKIVLPKESITVKAFRHIYDWMLNASAKPERDDLLETLNGAIFLGVRDLIKQIWYCIESHEYFTEFEAYLLYREANRLKVTYIDDIMLMRISKLFLTLVATNEFLQLPLKNVITLLQSDNIAVNTEKEVLFAAIRWLDHNRPTRDAHINEITACVRFTLLPASFLQQLKKPTNIELVNRISMLPTFKKQLTEALFAQSLLQFDDDQQYFSSLYKYFDIKKPRYRLFVYDNICAYHKSDPNAQQDHIDYSDFVKYLNALQQLGPQHLQRLQTMELSKYDVN